jgi:hypothetical protein
LFRRGQILSRKIWILVNLGLGFAVLTHEPRKAESRNRKESWMRKTGVITNRLRKLTAAMLAAVLALALVPGAALADESEQESGIETASAVAQLETGRALNISTALGCGRNIDIFGGSAAQGAKAIIWDNHTRANQRFTLQDAGDGYYYIKSVKSGLVLDIYGASAVPGVPSSNGRHTVGSTSSGTSRATPMVAAASPALWPPMPWMSPAPARPKVPS